MANFANQTTRLIAQSLPVFPTQTSFTQLFGDTFATQGADSLYLLEDLTGIGADLTNNNAVTFDSVTDLIISPVNVGTFDGVDQFLSTPTAVANQVGVGSFIASIWFKKDGLPIANESIFQYGETTGITWRTFIGTDGNIRTLIDDNTTSVLTIWENNVTDNKWHLASMIIDRNTNFMSLLIDGVLQSDSNGVTEIDISAVTGTLTDVGVNFQIGASNLTPANFYAGQLANFSLYIADASDATIPPDYNIISLLEAGLRENAIVGNWTLSNNSGARLNNNSQSTTDNQGDYTTSVINMSEGIYDIISLYPEALARGTMDVSIDGEVVFSQNQNAGSTTFNQSSFGTGIYISAGTHLLKVGSDTTTGTTHRYGFQMLELIKRDGANEGDNEATSGILFGDEFDRISDPAAFTTVVDTVNVYNNEFGYRSSGTADDGDSFEGDIFLKKGLYKFTYTYSQNIVNADVTITVGGVKVFDKLVTSQGGTVNNVTATRNAFIEGGKSTVKILADGNGGGGSDFTIIADSLRFELVTGRGAGDTVNVWSVDDDGQTVSGNVPTVIISTTTRFNFVAQVTTDALNDEQVWNRYFSGGTYILDYHHTQSATVGIIDLSVNGVVVINDYNGNSVTLDTNAHRFATVTIPRGFLNVNLKTVADGDVGDFRHNFTRIRFTKIADLESAEDDNSDPVHGALVPLAKHRAIQAETTTTFLLASLDMLNDYSKLIVNMKAEPNGTINFRMRINENTQSIYYDTVVRNIAGVVTGVQNDAVPQWTLASSAIVTATGEAFAGTVDISNSFETSANSFNIHGIASFGVWTDGTETGHHLFNSNTQTIRAITIFTSGSTWKAGAAFEVYGVKK